MAVFHEAQESLQGHAEGVWPRLPAARSAMPPPRLSGGGSAANSSGGESVIRSAH
ncbi:hypothetical protein PJI17_16250 [Mycobacterium kansasii]